MVEARFLGLRQEERSGTLTYYNLELPEWKQDTMVVDGVVVESLAPVRRVTLTALEFKLLLARQYKEITPELLKDIKRTCKFLGGGLVNVPAFMNR